jgi:heme oxygenase
MTVFSDEIVGAVLKHMNSDHTEDNVLIARANGFPGARAARMTGLDERGGSWVAEDSEGEHTFSLAWPGAPISERRQIREEVVKIYREAQSAAPEAQPSEHDSGSVSETSSASTGTGTSASASTGTGTDADGSSFAQTVKQSSWGRHAESEGADFMANIMRGVSPLIDYVNLVAQHFYIYEALEGQTEKHSGDELLDRFDSPELRRLGALEKDLEHLVGPGWKNEISAVPATREYAQRVNEIGEQGWIPGLIAHHYTRYLGDLSGGQMIAKRMCRQHGFEEDGVAFYNFEALGPIPKFKERYHASLDELGDLLSDADKQRFIDEVAVAYDFNTSVFEDLARQKSAESA